MNSADYTAMRRNMIDSQLRTNNVAGAALLQAIEQSPRELFVPQERASLAYMDRAIPLNDLGAQGRAVNPPLSTALLLNAANIRGTDAVLVIGAGTGYCAALVSRLAKSVVAVEDAAELMAPLAANLAAIGAQNVEVVQGPLSAGCAEKAPYDVIVIDGAIEHLPDAIVQQLADGGRIVTGQKSGPVTQLASGIKRGDGVALRIFIDCEITPLAEFARRAEFVF
jgi:protein-L-isoaspartate(D-aspartate) O-methyltransferase